MNLQILSGKLSKSHDSDIGFDIHTPVAMTIAPRSSVAVPTNLRISLPHQSFALVKPRSGLSFNHSIETGAGVIDEDYSGEIMVHLYNHSTKPYSIKRNDKIAQLIVLPRPHIDVSADSDSYSPASDAIRTDNGFGSTDEKE